MRKTVGVMPLYDELRESWWILPGYMKMLEDEGATPLLLPLTDDPEELDWFLDICGGFLLTGGQDVSPEFYGEAKQPYCGYCCEPRDRMDAYILRGAVERDRSVLGICRGIQLMNACFGGTLYQDLPTERPGNVNHHMDAPYDRAEHDVIVRPATPLFDAVGSERFGVNSCHHQAIKTLAGGFEVMAEAEDGVIEAIYMPSRKFVAGVQWHPEFFYLRDEASRKIARAFVRSI